MVVAKVGMRAHHDAFRRLARAQIIGRMNSNEMLFAKTIASYFYVGCRNSVI